MAEGQQCMDDSVSTRSLKGDVIWAKQNNAAHPNRMGLYAHTGFFEVLLLKNSPGHREIPISYHAHFKGKLQ